jgi:hypothetical protein
MSIGLNANNDGTGSIQIGGSDAINISTGLNVGIGTASPTAPLDVNGNVAITGSARRITGDFSNATLTSRVAFQTSTTNGNTNIYSLPNGTSTTAAFSAVNNPDPTNASFTQLLATSTDSSLRAAISGTGTYLPITFYTSGLERMRIDTSGNVGIGTSSPTTQLDLTRTVTGGAGLSFQANNPDTGASSASYVLAKQGSVSTGIYSYGNSGSYIGAITNNFAAFITNNTERMRIDTAGNVGIGTNAPAGILDVKGNTNGVIAQYLRNDSTGASSTSVYQISAGTRYVNQNVNYTGQFYQVIGSGIVLSYSDFDTQIWRNNAGTERMRIDSSGNLLVGTTSGVAKVVVQSPNAATAIVTGNTSGTALYNAALFYNNGLASLVGQIAVSGTTCSYNSLSDYRLKEDVQPMTGALEKVAALKPCTYTWKADGSAGQGFIAHELQAVVPDAVTGDKDAVNEDGSIKPQGIDTSFLVATLTAAIQEQQAMILELNAKVAALEAR